MNFFSVLDESDNEEDRKVVPAKKGTAAAAPAAATKKDAAPAPAKKDAAPAKKDAPKTAKAVEDKPKKDASKAPKVAQEGEKEAAKEDNRGGHRNRERHGEKQYGNKPDGEKRAPRREFDRRSGTGRGREVSRGGRGAFGAGNPAQDALDAEKNPQAAVEGAIDGAVEGAVVEEVVVEEVTPAEPEPVTFTLDEFMQKREEARQRLNGLTGAPAAIRTVDKEKDFAGLTTVVAGELENYLGSSAGKAEAARKDQRSSGKAVVSNVGFKFPAVQPEREQRDRDGPRTGGRGGDREGGRGPRREGGAGRGAGRGERPARPASGAAAAFNAEKDFPKL